MTFTPYSFKISYRPLNPAGLKVFEERKRLKLTYS